jgi:gas vesicle protein
MFYKKLFGCRSCDQQKSKNIKKIAIFSTISAGIGAFLGLLFAPKKGSEFRKDIADKSKEISSNLAQKSKDFASKTKSKIVEIENKIHPKKVVREELEQIQTENETQE